MLIFFVLLLVGVLVKLLLVFVVCIWFVVDYICVMFEYDVLFKYMYFIIENFDCLVVDIEGVEFNSVFDSLVCKVVIDDFYIKLLCVGCFKLGVVCLVMELKIRVNL